MSTEEDKKVLTEKRFKVGGAPRPTKAKIYEDFLSDKLIYEERCETIFNAWKKDRDDDKAMRRKYAFWITVFVLLQVFVVYAVIIIRLWWNVGTSTVEYLGVVGAILAQSFGVFYLVVKYFFGKRPEDLEKISSFFLNCHPSQFGSGYRDKWEK